MNHDAAALPDAPRLREGLEAYCDDDPNFTVLVDPLRLAREPLRLSRRELTWASLMTGQRTLRDLQGMLIRSNGGVLITLEEVRRLVERLDAGGYLDSPRLRARLTGTVREPACIGCYPPDPPAIRRLLDGLFSHRDGPGRPGEPNPDPGLRAVLVPHMDYARGGVTYAWGFKEVFERAAASLFVIVGTSHYSRHRFTLTRQHFRTPLGMVETDQAFLDRLVAHYGDGLFDDPVAHIPEHSIELEVLLLQYYYAGRRPIRIVPLLVGSFHDCFFLGTDPAEQPEVQRMVAALRAAEAETPEPVCFLISGDLAHVGPKFGDVEPVGESFLSESKKSDDAILARAAAADPAGYFRLVAGEADARRICGLPPTYLILEALKPSRGRLAHYGRYVHPRGFESVSFASMVFER
jgi:AmmeMemoRadiSam system protein B